VIKEQESDCDSYDGEVEDISVYEFRSDTSMSEIDITDSNSHSSIDIQVQVYHTAQNI
jgi:hypothetical protein